MKWYEGDIAHAITVSKNKKAIFVVLVKGQDENSLDLINQIDETDISQKLESELFVAIKIDGGSLAHNQFTAIYKNAPIPSLHFIGKNGKLLDIILKSQNPQELLKRIDVVIDKHVTETGMPRPTFNSTNTENATSQETPNNNESASGSSQASVADAANSLSTEEKVQRAKELVEKQREVKKKADEEEEKKKEIERRELGKNVQKMRHWQKDQELKNMIEERQRDKIEERAARERILAQIAMDKAERAARFSATTSATHPNQQPSTSTQIHKPIGAHNMARLQFRLPDGSSTMNEFDAISTLLDVRNFISTNLNLPFRTYSLSTTFPRREFTDVDNTLTLLELELFPNAVILILPTNSAGTVTTNNQSGFMSMIWFVLSPIFGIFNYFRSLIFGPPNTPSVPPPPSSPTPGRVNKPPQTGNQDSFSPQKPKRSTDSTVIRRQGNSNIYRLKDRRDSDDDNNTWNGNSTQQM